MHYELRGLFIHHRSLVSTFWLGSSTAGPIRYINRLLLACCFLTSFSLISASSCILIIHSRTSRSTHPIMFSFTKIASFAVLALGTLASVSALPTVKDVAPAVVAGPVVVPRTIIQERDGNTVATIFSSLNVQLGPVLCALPSSPSFAPKLTDQLIYFSWPFRGQGCRHCPVWSHSSDLAHPVGDDVFVGPCRAATGPGARQVGREWSPQRR